MTKTQVALQLTLKMFESTAADMRVQYATNMPKLAVKYAEAFNAIYNALELPEAESPANQILTAAEVERRLDEFKRKQGTES